MTARRSEIELMRMARHRWAKAGMAFDAGDRASGWVHLLAMGCCMAAAQGRELDTDIETIARDGGLLP